MPVRAIRRSALGLLLALCLALPGAAGGAEDHTTEKILEGMTLKEKIGQLFLADCPADAEAAARTYHPGGYVLFAANFQNETPESAKAAIARYQAASKVPMLIAVDEEGGDVTRVSRFAAFRGEKFPSPQAVYAAGGWAAIRADAREKAALLKPLGVNVNLAPVADLPTSAKSFIYSRSFGTDPALTARFVAEMVTESRKAGLGAVLKHFPGYGDNGDTHTAAITDGRPLSAFENRDYLPFLAGIEAGAQAVMVSHNIVTALDAEYPASLSPAVNAALRGLGFDGVIMTDDLAMDAVADAYGQAEAAVLAVEAGSDMVIAGDLAACAQAVYAAVQSGRVSEARVDESVRRILKWKESLGLI